MFVLVETGLPPRQNPFFFPEPSWGWGAHHLTGQLAPGPGQIWVLVIGKLFSSVAQKFSFFIFSATSPQILVLLFESQQHTSTSFATHSSLECYDTVLLE